MSKSILMVLLTLSLVCIGCNRKPAKLYQGLPMKVWAERLNAEDPSEREDALKVVMEMKHDAAKLEDRLRQIARNDPYPDLRYLAIGALDSMNAMTDEFAPFKELYNQPLLGDGEKEENPELDQEASDLTQKSSSDDDFEYLKELTSGQVDSLDADTIVPEMEPSQSEEIGKLEQMKRSEEVDNLMNQLRNPSVLAALLQSGEDSERRFAARSLAQLEGDDPTIRASLEQARLDADSLVRAYAEQALGNWGGAKSTSRSLRELKRK